MFHKPRGLDKFRIIQDRLPSKNVSLHMIYMIHGGCRWMGTMRVEKVVLKRARGPSREVEISLENPCKAPMDGSDGWRGEKIYRKNRQIEVETMSANVASMNATRTGMKTTQGARGARRAAVR